MTSSFLNLCLMNHDFFKFDKLFCVMKYLSLILVFLLVSVNTYCQDTGSGVSEAILSVDELFHDFGDIHPGDEVEYTFQFKNTGNQPLILSNVLVQCGCTATEWPREPVEAGQSGKITVRFDSEGKSGIQKKVITIVSNASNDHERLKIQTNILPEDVNVK